MVVDQATGARRVLSGEVPCELAELWSESVGLQAICEVELLAVMALREIMGESLRDRRVIFWVDNESARFGLNQRYFEKPAHAELATSVL